MMTMQQAVDRISMAGLSYLVSERKEYVVILAGEHRVVFVPADEHWLGMGGQRGVGLDKLIAGLKPIRDAT